MIRLDDATHVRTGNLFEVLRAGDRAVKRVARRDPGGVAAMWSLSNLTNNFYTRGLGFPIETEPLPDAFYDALLVAEHTVIERAGEHWNHPGVELDRDERGATCLVMPWASGTQLSTMTFAEQRRWFPAMLPPLWRALAQCPHGDLAPDDLLVDLSGGLFRILDPGVCIEGPERSEEADSFEFGSRLFTTNLARYPLILPEHGPELPRRRADGVDVIARIEQEHASVVSPMLRPAAPPTTPAAADVVACGALYFGILTGQSLPAALGLDRPLWASFWRDGVGHEPPDDPFAGDVLVRALAGAAEPEARLCEGLIRLTLNLDGVVQLAVDANRLRR